MSAETYDPFGLERPKLKLGNHGAWTFGDITESRSAKLGEIREGLIAVEAKRSEAKMADVARMVGDLAQAACINSDGLSDLIVDLADEAKHGEDALGAKALGGLVDFILDWLTEESGAGEG